jgi:hypothetical protein
MENSPQNADTFGLSFTVFIVFLILKLTDNIDWSWWWIFSPLWIPIALVIGLFALIFFFMLIYTAFTGKNLLDLF